MTVGNILCAVFLVFSVLLLSALPWLVVRTVVTARAQELYSDSKYKKIYKQILNQGVWGRFTMFSWWSTTHSPEILRRLAVYWCYCAIVLGFCAAMALSALGFIYYGLLYGPYLIFKAMELGFCFLWFKANQR